MRLLVVGQESPVIVDPLDIALQLPQLPHPIHRLRHPVIPIRSPCRKTLKLLHKFLLDGWGRLLIPIVVQLDESGQLELAQNEASL